MKKLIILLGIHPFSAALADGRLLLPVDDTPDTRLEAQPLSTPPEIAPPVGAAAHKPVSGSLTPSAITEQELLNNRSLTESLINRAVMEQRWDWLEYLLPLYRQIPAYDDVLADYAQGALWRHQGRHRAAIDAYRGIIARAPQLVYVRLNLAAMLFENKEYTAAKAQFEKVRTEPISPASLALVNHYLAAIDKQGGWSLAAGLNYERTDNVNNASAIKEITLGKLTFQKNADSLPQKAQGIRYSGSLSRDFNLAGNHYLSVDGAVYGVNYWDNHDYDQTTVRAGSGYVYRDIAQWASLKPYFEKTWLNSQAYAQTPGISAEYGRWLNKNWQTVAAADLSRTNYQDYTRFDGNRLALSATVAYLPNARLFVYGGADWINETARDPAEASIRKSLRIGTSYEWPLGISSRLNLRYAHRDFKANNFYFGYPRRDHEYQSTVSLWHRKLNFWGITPKLNWQYSKIDSNIPAFYSRSGNRVFIGADKTF